MLACRLADVPHNRPLVPDQPSIPFYQSMFHIVLFQPEIPENTGAVGRTCVAAGADLFLVKPLGFQLDHRRIARSGMDYWQFLNVQTADDWSDLRLKLPGRCWFFTKKAVKSYVDVQYRPEDVLVFGCESRGLPDFILDAAPEQCLKIPIAEESRSLNLSVSVGIALYEAQRQTSGY